MIRVFANANYDFIGYRRIAYLVSALLVIPGLLLTLVRGFNYSIEFTGGALVQLAASRDVAIGDVRSALSEAGMVAEITTIGSGREFVIRTRLEGVASATGEPDEAAAAETAARVTSVLNADFGEGTFRLDRRDAVSAKVGGEMRQRAALAVMLSFLVVLVYLAFRFEWRVGVAAVVATIYDIVATIAFISYLNLEISLVVVSGILTVIGYSLNDKIVVFDRMRENLHKYKRDDFAGILNRSVNEVLPRTVLTGGTALTALVCMAVFSGDVIRPFALVMIFGIVSGTFSSIYIGSPVLLWIEQKWPGKEARGVKARVSPAAGRAEAPPVAGV